METVSLVASIVSVILGIYAIWLSIVFYRMSIDASAKLEKASSDVSENVKRLEGLFDRMYSDTFGLVRDTYKDMREEMWAKRGTVRELTPDSVEPLADPMQMPLPVPIPPVSVPDFLKMESSHPRQQEARDAMRRGMMRMWAKGRPVTPQILTDIAEKVGLDPRAAIDLLFDMFGAKEFYTVGGGLAPDSELVGSPQEAERLYDAALDKRLDAVLGENDRDS